MRTRLSFATLLTFLTILLIGLLPSAQMVPANIPATRTVPVETPTTFIGFPTRPAKTSTSAPLPPTFTPVPTETLALVSTPTLIPFPSGTATVYGGTPTPAVPIAYTGTAAECYKGPAKEYVVRTTFQTAEIVGKNKTATWWFLEVSKGRGVYIECWVAADQVNTAGDLSRITVSEAELAQVTKVEIAPLGQQPGSTEYVMDISCGASVDQTVLHFTGRVFADGPLEEVHAVWKTNAPAHGSQPGKITIESWGKPAQFDLALQLPAQAATYLLSLQTQFPNELNNAIQLTLKCH